MRTNPKLRFEQRVFLMAGIFTNPATVLAYELRAIALAKQCETPRQLARALRIIRAEISAKVSAVLLKLAR